MLIAALWMAGALAVAHDRAEIVGTWRGTSLCTDLKVAPSCHDETVVYEVTPAPKPGAVTVNADKIVNGERLAMGELEFAWDTHDACWRHELQNGRVHAVFCLTVEGRALTGTLRDVPTKAQVRKIQLTRD